MKKNLFSTNTSFCPEMMKDRAVFTNANRNSYYTIYGMLPFGIILI